MADLTFKQFEVYVEPCIKGSRCPIKKAIAKQLKSISTDPNWQEKAVTEALTLANLDWSGNKATIISDLAKGVGHRDVALALYYWLHSQPERWEHAQEVDQTAWHKLSFFEKHDVRVFEHGAFDAGIESSDASNPHDRAVSDAIKLYQQRLNEAWLNSQEYPCLLLMLTEIEEILMMQCVSYPKRNGFFCLRSVLDKQPWLGTLEFDAYSKSSHDATEWITTHGPFYTFVENRRFAIVRTKDGARVSTDALHRIQSWLDKLWILREDKIIKRKNIDLFLRYILVFAQANRSEYMKGYFNDRAVRIDQLIRSAVERAAEIGMDLRDYAPIDKNYDHFYRIKRGPV